MNILTITSNDNGVGGATRVAMDLNRAYGRVGHGTHVLAGRKTSDANNVTELSRPFWRKAASYLFANDFDFFDGGQVLRSPHFRDADIVHCHNLNGWYFNLPVLGRMSRLKPVVWTLHDMWAISPHSAYTDSREIENGLYRLSDPTHYPSMPWNNRRHLARRKSEIYRQMNVDLVAPSQWLADLVRPTALGSRPVRTIYNGIEMSSFARQDKRAARAQLGLKEAPTALFVSASALTNPFKGYADFEWIALSLPGEIAQFVGVGGDKDRTGGPIAQFATTADKARIATFLSAADVLVMPSRHEVFPLLMVEALACGTPVIAYDVGGIGELLATAPGCTLVAANDREALKTAVRETLSRPSNEREAISQEARRRVETAYSIERAASEYLELFDSLLAARGTSSG